MVLSARFGLAGRLDHLKKADGRWALDILGQALLQPGADDRRSRIGTLLRCPQNVETVLPIRVIAKEGDGLAPRSGPDGRDQIIGQALCGSLLSWPKAKPHQPYEHASLLAACPS